MLISFQEREADARSYAAELHKLDDRLAERDRIIAEKDRAISDLRAVIRTGELNPGVEGWLADEEIKTALGKRDSAYRSRDFAFKALWRLAKPTIAMTTTPTGEHAAAMRDPAKNCKPYLRS